jgi:hypothetical protein
MAKAQVERCDSCRYWLRDTGKDRMGNCRKHPPTAVPDPVTVDDGQCSRVGAITCVPSTPQEWWCGAWETR